MHIQDKKDAIGFDLRNSEIRLPRLYLTPTSVSKRSVCSREANNNSIMGNGFISNGNNQYLWLVRGENGSYLKLDEMLTQH